MASFRGLDPKQWTGLKEERGTVDITPGARMNLAEINGAGAIASLRLSLPQAKDALDSVWLCMSWDGATNDVEAPVRFRSSIRCGIEHGGVNDTDSRYGSLAFWYARDCLGLVQNDAFSFSGAGVQMLTNYFEGDDDDVTVTCAILKTTEPVTRTLAIDPAKRRRAGAAIRR